MTDPRPGDIGSFGPAGSSSGTAAVGAAASGRAGGTYAPVIGPDELVEDEAGEAVEQRQDERGVASRTVHRVDDADPDLPADHEPAADPARPAADSALPGAEPPVSLSDPVPADAELAPADAGKTGPQHGSTSNLEPASPGSGGASYPEVIPSGPAPTHFEPAPAYAVPRQVSADRPPAAAEPGRTPAAWPPPRVQTPPPAPVSRPRKGVRRARLRLTRIDPWSALKVSLVFAALLFVVWMIAVVVLFAILQGAGVFDSVNSTLTDVFGAHVDFSGALILGGAAVFGALSVVIVTALGTIVAFAYNVTASLLGGLDVTLTEQE